jgi:drug/metabolite transporter (DMT)-like permease
MLWLLFSLLTALAVSLQDTWVKRFFSGMTSYEMSTYPLVYSLPLFLLSILFVPVPPLGDDFAWTFAVSLPLNAVGFILYMRAIKCSPLSLTVPYLAFTPVFMLATGYLFLDEIPPPRGLAGILLICIGGYILNIDPARFRLLAPFRAVFHETGSWTMLIVAFVYSFTAVIGKKAILNSSPLFFGISFFIAFNLSLVILLRFTGRIRFATFGRAPFKGLVSGIFLYFQIVFHCTAVALVEAAVMISVKRLSILFSILFGKLIFQERHASIRFSGALLMLFGTLLITL